MQTNDGSVFDAFLNTQISCSVVLDYLLNAAESRLCLRHKPGKSFHGIPQPQDGQSQQQIEIEERYTQLTAHYSTNQSIGNEAYVKVMLIAFEVLVWRCTPGKTVSQEFWPPTWSHALER